MMDTLKFDIGVAHVAETLRSGRDANRPAAAFVGAGISISAGIPGGNALAAEIRRTFPIRCTQLTSAQSTHYGHVMGALAPSQRKSLIADKIRRARLNWANIALAQLVSEGYFARVDGQLRSVARQGLRSRRLPSGDL
jgi:hypothetical protein